MILGSNERLTIGERRHLLTHPVTREETLQPFVILRETTVEEWEACMAEEGATFSERELAHVRFCAMKGYAFFYEVSLD